MEHVTVVNLSSSGGSVLCGFNLFEYLKRVCELASYHIKEIYKSLLIKQLIAGLSYDRFSIFFLYV